MNTEQAVNFLASDVLLHIDMLESIKNGNAIILQATEHGVLLFNTAGQTYMMSANDEQTADKMIAGVEQAFMFVAHQKSYIPKIQNKFSFRETLECHQAAYLHKELLPEPHNSIIIRKLDEHYLSFIMRHYSRNTGEDYLLERLKSGVMHGAFSGDNLAGFIGMHAEGSIGILEVLPRYRRQGIALALETYMANLLLAKKCTPFSQVVVGNAASIELHKKLNFSFSDKTVFWLM